MAKKPEIPVTPELSEISLKELDFTPEVLNELYDALNQTKEVITTYYEMSARFPSKMREDIGLLMIESDLLLLEFNSVYITAGMLIEKLKKRHFLGMKVSISKKEKEDFQQRLNFLKLRVRSLIHEIESYVKEVKSLQKKEPLPIS